MCDQSGKCKCASTSQEPPLETRRFFAALVAGLLLLGMVAPWISLRSLEIRVSKLEPNGNLSVSVGDRMIDGTWRQISISSDGVLAPMNALQSAAEGVASGDRFLPHVSEEMKLSEFKSKALVVAFWSPFCPHCVKELDILSEIRRSFPRKEDLEILALTIPLKGQAALQLQSSPPEILDVFRTALPVLTVGIDPHVSDEQGDQKGLFADYGIQSIPVLYVFDENRRTIYRSVGTATSADLTGAIRKVVR